METVVTGKPVSFWERHGGAVLAGASLALALLLTALIALPALRPLRAAIGLDWESHHQGFFRDCTLVEYADDDICRNRDADDRAREEWKRIRTTKGGNIQFSIP